MNWASMIKSLVQRSTVTSPLAAWFSFCRDEFCSDSTSAESLPWTTAGCTSQLVVSCVPSSYFWYRPGADGNLGSLGVVLGPDAMAMSLIGTRDVKPRTRTCTEDEKTSFKARTEECEKRVARELVPYRQAIHLVHVCDQLVLRTCAHSNPQSVIYPM